METSRLLYSSRMIQHRQPGHGHLDQLRACQRAVVIDVQLGEDVLARKARPWPATRRARKEQQKIEFFFREKCGKLWKNMETCGKLLVFEGLTWFNIGNNVD